MATSTSRSIILHTELIDSDMLASLQHRLIAEAAAFDLNVTPEQARLCIEHLLYMQQVNSYINLTRIVDIDDAVILHILDSLLLCKGLQSQRGRFLDMGTGAGFPGIPFHIFTGCEGILLDSVGKKVDAVNAFISHLGLQRVHGVHDRLESYAVQQRNTFDMVVARAVGQLPLLIEYGAPFLRENGLLILAKANPAPEELETGARAASLCGLKEVNQLSFDLPYDLGHRTVIHYHKVCEPSISLPRAVGVAKKTPLA